jgi:hypothetical protein
MSTLAKRLSCAAVCVLVCSAGVGLTGCNFSLEAPTGPQEMTVRYQGTKFVVTKPESNFDDSDTRRFVKLEDAEQIEQLLLAAPVEQHYNSLTDLIAAMEAIQFPDYGRTVLEQPTTQKGKDAEGKDIPKRVFFVTIEVPRRNKDRCFTFYGDDTAGYDLADEFVLEAKPLPKPKDAEPDAEVQYERKAITTVKTDGKKFQYLDPFGQKVREK